ncbi:Plastocyanin [Nocardioides exalbidus]|uniref:Plastocyanin n=1 Tax=Nocardioides exalbidus TaxID=402596 RepID=A0A1H4KXH5_9ACTN|nr:PKD domain-containing protein [Nocardioides exalbidus]SEB63214.1 Plastocyanin [Nocardioides exalbidus]
MPRAARSAARPTSRTRTVLTVLALVCAVLPGAWVAATASTGSTSAAAAGRTWVVDAIDPATGTSGLNRWESVDTGRNIVTIAVGDTVEWQFDRASQAHDLVSLPPRDPWDEAWDFSADWAPGDGSDTTFTHTFDEVGTYNYWCSLHGTTMSGTVVVTDDANNTAPTASPVVALDTVTTNVLHATANATDADGDPLNISWDFGVAGARSSDNHAMHDYVAPGQYVVRLRVSDGRGGLYAQDFPITVTGGGGTTEPPADDALPEIDALAAGGPSLTAAFSTQVTTRGTLAPFAAWTSADGPLAGEATMVRRRVSTYTSLSVTGAKPSTSYNQVHVHEQPCGVGDGGVHYRFDETQPFAEVNEIWPLFTTGAGGASGLVEVTKPVRASAKAVSLVVHDPAMASRRLACADLAPSTSDLVYVWSFGDGTTATGADPDHTYAAPGTYTATVTVTHGSGAHAGHTSVSDSVQVVVGGGRPTPTPPPVPPAVPVVDSTPPRISQLGPRGTSASARPTIRVRVRDRDSAVRKKDVVLRVDGRKAAGLRYDAKRGLVTWRSTKALAPGRHVVRLVVRDTAGNKATKTWWFKVRPRP